MPRVPRDCVVCGERAAAPRYPSRWRVLVAVAVSLLLPDRFLAAPAEPVPPPLGPRAALPVVQSVELLQLRAGSRLRLRPQPEAPVALILDEALALPIVERREGWVAVRYGQRILWFAAPGGLVPAGAERSPEEERRLVRARALLPAGTTALACGPFTLWLDPDDGARRQRLCAVAAELPAGYTQRYGLKAEGLRQTEVVILTRDEDFARYAAADADLAPIRAQGHAVGRLAVLTAGGLPTEDLAGLLVHELTHLLNRQVFASELPPWLEEGLAEELGTSRLDERGRLVPGTIRGGRRETRESRRRAEGGVQIWTQVETSGEWVVLLELAAHPPNAAAWAALFAISNEAFSAPEGRSRRYAMSGLLLHYLLDARQPAQAEACRRFLAVTAAGAPAEPERLLATLGLDLDRLAAAFGDWLAATGRALPIVGP